MRGVTKNVGTVGRIVLTPRPNPFSISKSSRMKTRATATVKITLHVSNLGAWGEDCSIGQLHRQAKEGAAGMVRRALRDADGKPLPDIHIVGDPVVTGIVTVEE